MAKTIIDTTKDQQQAFNKYITSKLRQLFDNEVYDVGELQAKVNLINNKDFIIDNIISEISKNVPTSFNHFWQYTSATDTISIINKIYLKEYNETFKAYKIKEKAEKELLKSEIYEQIKIDISGALINNNIYDTINYIKTIDYKELCFNTLKKELENIDENIFNDLYTTILNKVVKEYNQDLKQYNDSKKCQIQLAKERQKQKEKQQQEYLKAKKNKIPLGWKVYGVTKAINKLWK